MLGAAKRYADIDRECYAAFARHGSGGNPRLPQRKAATEALDKLAGRQMGQA
jgi:hypothetical protein